MREFIPSFDNFAMNEATLRVSKRLDDETHKKYNEAKYKFLERQIALCKKHGVTCMADFGTLLGIIRDGDLIRNDNDTDLQVFGDTLNKDFIEELQKTFFVNILSKSSLKKLFAEDDDYVDLMYIWLEDIDKDGNKITFKSPSGFKLGMFGDMMISYPYENGKRILRWPGWETMTYDANFAKNIKKVSFKGFDVPVPSDPEKYIAYFYGDTWKTPQSNFGGYTCDWVPRGKAHSYMYSLKENKFKI